jgi:hypothetical protein
MLQLLQEPPLLKGASDSYLRDRVPCGEPRSRALIRPSHNAHPFVPFAPFAQCAINPLEIARHACYLHKEDVNVEAAGISWKSASSIADTAATD